MGSKSHEQAGPDQEVDWRQDLSCCKDTNGEDLITAEDKASDTQRRHAASEYLSASSIRREHFARERVLCPYEVSYSKLAITLSTTDDPGCSRLLTESPDEKQRRKRQEAISALTADVEDSANWNAFMALNDYNQARPGQFESSAIDSGIEKRARAAAWRRQR